ncbi:hypothetical protein Tco_1256585 [Tanacetum coccineum]
MYTFSPMMVANSRKHHCRVRPYTREVLVLSTNLEIQTKHYPLVFRNRRGDEADSRTTLGIIKRSRVPLIIGRSFLRIDRALIDVYGEEITLRVNDESVGPHGTKAESDSLPHAHTQATKTYYKHQDSRIKKAQELNTKTSANSDIQDLP